MKISEIPKEYNNEYRNKLGNLLNTNLTKFNNEIFYIMQNENNEEIGLRRIVYNLEEKYFNEYLLNKYKGSNIGFFTGTYIKKEYRNKGLGTEMFNVGLKKLKELNQKYVFSDARDTSLGIFIKNGFLKIGTKISPEKIKETIVIKKL